jgi:RNA polymerase sigma-70 factor, ECF subfamily
MSDPERFVRDHQTSLWRYLRLLGANAADAEDLLQETFLRFLRRTEPHPAAAAALRTIARGLWIDRQRWLRRSRAVQWADELDRTLSTPAADRGHELWLDALAECRGKLTERARTALELAYRDGLGRDQIAATIGLAANTIRNLLAAARDALRQCIEQRLQRLEQPR